jgi:ribonuclease III
MVYTNSVTKSKTNGTEVNAVVKIITPWNPNNKVIPNSEILRFLQRQGVVLPNNLDFDLFRRACVHKSYVEKPPGTPGPNGEIIQLSDKPADCLPLQKAHNEELEFVGDSVLNCVVAIYSQDRYDGEGEGFLTTLRGNLVNNDHLGVLAQKMGMSEWLVMSRHVDSICKGRENLRLLGSMVEAWIGALYRNTEIVAGKGAAFEVCYNWIISILHQYVNFAKVISENHNYKDQLLKYFQSQYHTPPTYEEIHVEGPQHDRIYTIGVYLPNRTLLASAISRKKLEAEQEASRLALVSVGALLG